MIIRSENLEQKRQTLQNAKVNVKSQFVGLDRTIDEIFDCIEPWYLMPDGQIRPNIICLWGPTGCGKTSMVRAIAKALNSEIAEFDAGDFSSSNEGLGYILDETFRDFSGKDAILLLDDIHMARTLHEDGSEKQSDGIRALWSLLSDGLMKVKATNSASYYRRILKRYYYLYSYCLKNHALPNLSDCYDPVPEEYIQHPETSPKIIYDGDTVSENLSIDHIYKDHMSQKERGISRDSAPWTINLYALKEILTLCEKVDMIKYFINGLEANYTDALIELMRMLDGVKYKGQKELDFRKSTIFICGNVDEAYRRIINYDLSIDSVSKLSESINITDIKYALKYRFRMEQISRFGNNHIIYKIFDSNTFKNIIKMELNKLYNFINQKVNISIESSDSVINLIFNEAVFPDQGIRPIFSSIDSIVKTSISNFISFAISKQIDILDNIRLEYKDKKMMFYMGSNLIFECDIILRMDEIGEPIYDDEHITISIHEAGHTLISCIMGKIPFEVSAYGLHQVRGYTTEELMGERFILRQEMFGSMHVSLGGWASEALILGDDYISNGAQVDLKKLTSMACDWVEKNGFNLHPEFYISKLTEDTSSSYLARTDENDREIKDIINTVKDNVYNMVNDNKKIILDLSTEILMNSVVMGNRIKDICDRHGLKMNKYNKIKDIFEDKLAEHGIDFDPHRSSDE